MQNTIIEKPGWLDKKISLGQYKELSSLFESLNLNTVCQQAACPNMGECFGSGVAAFLILGKICTRACRFCAIKKAKPEAVDYDQPGRVSQAVRRLDLRHVVITSVTRDDLSDGGAEMFSRTISCIKELGRDIKIEVLVPDFKARIESIKKVIDAGPDIFSHNLETVDRLYKQVRTDADYKRSLAVLDAAKRINSDIYTKSGLMLGLGETESEVLDALFDLRKIGCDFLSLGQYLAPSQKHFPVKEYISPDKFKWYKEQAFKLGFLHAECGPYVRSSYLASQYMPAEVGKGVYLG